MKRKEWWNKPMTRKNWLVLISISVGLTLVELGYVFYASSIKKAAEKWKKEASDMLSDVKQRF